MDFKFIKYEPTPNEKHLGIATVKAYDKIILRYKIVQTKDGTGIFPAPASYKMSLNGEDRYISAFTVDSVSDNDDLSAMIKREASKAISGNSVFTKTQSIEEIEEVPF